MRIRASLALIFALLLAILVIPTPAAVAAPVWTPPRVFEPSRVQPGVAGNEAGQSVAVWLEISPTGTYQLLASFRDPDGDWGPPRLISERPDVSNVSHAPHVTMSDTGRVIVTWREWHFGPIDLGHPEKLYAVRGGRRGWTEPIELASNLVQSSPSLDQDTKGNVLVAWHQTDGCWLLEVSPEDCLSEEYEQGRAHLRTVLLPMRGDWGAPVVVGPEGRSPDVVLDEDGSAEFVWFRTVGRDGPEGDVLAATRSAAGEWSTPEVLASVDEFAGSPRLVRDPQGNLTAVWSACEGDACRLVAASRPASGGWSPPVALAENVKDVSRSVETVVDGEGRVTVVWWDPATEGVESVRRATDGTWEQVTRLSGEAGTATAATVDVDAAGNVVALWSELDGATLSFRTRLRTPDGAWEPADVLHTRADRRTRSSRWHDVTALPDSFAAFFLGAESTLFSERVDDVSAPVARVSPAGAVLRAGAARVAWSVRDGEAGVASVVVRRRTAEFDGGLGAWSVWRRSSGSGSAAVRAVPGRAQCFSVRATDRVGNASGWSRQRCASAPVDDRSATASGWRRARNPKAFRNTWSVATRAGARLVLPRVQARSVGVLASTCRSCGRVEVRLGGKRLGVVSLRSARVRHQRVVRVAEFAKARKGRLVVRVVSSGQPVQIDGFVIGR